MARICRPGQQLDCLTFRLYTRYGVEEQLMRMQQDKLNLAADFFSTQQFKATEHFYTELFLSTSNWEDYQAAKENGATLGYLRGKVGSPGRQVMMQSISHL